MNQKIIGGHDIIVNVNIDGLPLFKSSNISLWPILGLITNQRDSTPFPIAIFSGKGKPINCSEFLDDFLKEYLTLQQEGIIFNGQKFTLKIQGVICDAPARQYLKCIKAHNGYNSCERCEVKGEYFEGRMVFQSTENVLRTTENFNTMSYPLHQNGRSPFIDTNIDCIKEFPLDYMHLVLLGTVKRLLSFLKEGPRVCRISSQQITEISRRLNCYRNKIPFTLILKSQFT